MRSVAEAAQVLFIGCLTTQSAPVSDDDSMPIALTPGEDTGRYDSGLFDPFALADSKEGRRVSVCIPARNEAATVGPDRLAGGCAPGGRGGGHR